MPTEHQRQRQSQERVYNETVQVPGGWANLLMPGRITVPPQYPWERAFYTDEQQALEAAARTAQFQYDAVWRTDPRKRALLFLLGLLGAK